MVTRMYRDMVLVLGPAQRLTSKVTSSVDRTFDFWLPKCENEAQAARRCQISWNHRHMPSVLAATKVIADVARDFKQRYPKLAHSLVAHWVPVSHTFGPEKGNMVMVSFYLDKEM